MKFYYYLATAALIIIIGILSYFLWIKPDKTTVIHKTEYKDSPIVDSLKNDIIKKNIRILQLKDTLKKVAYTRLIYKTDTLYVLKETLKHDTAFIFAADIINYQDSIINNKDLIIVDLTKEIKLTKDTAYYFQELYNTTNKKLKRWRWFGLGSGALNAFLLIKK